MDLDERKDAIKRWASNTWADKSELFNRGYKTWEFWMFTITLLAVLLSPIYAPGIYAAEDTTPNSEPYETVIPFDQGSQTTYVTIDCQPDDFITTENVAYRCDFRFEKSDDSLQKYDESYIREAREETIFVRDWTRRTDPETRVREGGYRFLTDDLVHQSSDGRYTIHGEFYVMAPRTPAIYSFSISMGEFFGGEKGSVQSVTVFSPSEASTLQTREFLMPFQQLILIGILLSLLKFWIDLFDRIAAKIND